MKALGVYIFAGGFTQGVKKHAQVMAHFEDAPYLGTETSKLNHPKVPIFFRNGKETWDELDLFTNKVDFVYANPPCAIVSPIGKSMKNGRDSWRTDPRLGCWKRSYSAINLNPSILAIESVPGMVSPKKARPFIDELARDAMKRGYSVTYLMHDGGLMGLPQHRLRFFFIAHKHVLRLPKLTQMEVPTVGQVLSRVDDPGWSHPLTSEQKMVWRKLKLGSVRGKRGQSYPKWEKFKNCWCRVTGEPASGHTDRKGRPLFMHARLHEDRPSNAFAGNYWFHPTEPRHLGVNEMKALCGYPLDYKMAGRPGKTATLLAQAVLPPVGDWIARMAKMTLNKKAMINRPTAHLVDMQLRKKTQWEVQTHDLFGDEQYDLVDYIEAAA